MPTRDEWRSLIEAATAGRPAPKRAATFVKRWGTFSHPAELTLEDGSGNVVVKGRQIGRAIINDHVVAKLGNILGAAVPDVLLVEVPDELIQREPDLVGFAPGVAHGARRIDNVRDGGVEHCDEPLNPPRFALLAVLYGWVLAGNQQFLYRTDSPPLVFSADHGHFFPSGPDWTIDSLGQAGPPSLDPVILAGCALPEAAVAVALGKLQKVSDEQIAEAVAAPLEEWGLLIDERIELASYLAQRGSVFLHDEKGGEGRT